MDKTQIKAALIKNAAEAKQDRKDYFARKNPDYHYDHRDQSLRLETRALHIALAYLQYRPFNAVEKYEYSTRPEKMEISIWADRYTDQLKAIRTAKEILSMVEVVQVGMTTRTKVVDHPEFDSWIKGTYRQALVNEAA